MKLRDPRGGVLGTPCRPGCSAPPSAAKSDPCHIRGSKDLVPFALKEGPPAMRGKSLSHEAALRWAYLAGFVWFGLTAVLAFSIL